MVINMEIGGMSTAYADYLAGQASAGKTTSLKNKLEGGYSTATDEELKSACKEFEAYFVEQVFNAMLETTKVFSDEDENTYASKMVDCFKDTAIQQLCNQATEGDGLGLAKTLYEQMKRQYSAEKVIVEKNNY